MKKFIFGKKNLSIALIVSKTLDLYNSKLFLNKYINETKSITIFIGKDCDNKTNLLSIKNFYPRAKIKIYRSGDFYSGFIKKFLLKIESKKLINDEIDKFLILITKFISLIFSKLYWFPFFIINFFHNKGRTYDLIITDPWASKIIKLCTLKFKYLIFQDGGNSTDSFKLLDPLFYKNFIKYEPLEIAKKSLYRQKVKIPFLLKLYVFSRLNSIPESNIFFSTNKYLLQKSLSRVSQKKLIAKDLPESILVINNKNSKEISFIRNELFIILGKDKDKYYEKAIKKILNKRFFQKVYIRPHPCGNCKKDYFPKLCRILENYSLNIIFLDIENSFEEYFLDNTKFPKTCLLHEDCSTNIFLNPYEKVGLKLIYF